MSVHLLLVGDIHIRMDNFDEVDLLLDQVCSFLQDQRRKGFPTELVLLGDLLHTFEKIFTGCLNKACDFIRRCSTITKTYVLVGNHDYINQHQFQTEQHWMNPLKYWDNVVIVDHAIYVSSRTGPDQVIGILLCPYVPVGRLIEALKTATDDWEHVDLILCHQEIKNCKMGTFLSESGDEWKDSYPQLISGHIHETQQIGKNVYYPGAPLQHGASDHQKDRIMCLVVVSSGNVQKAGIILNVPRKETVKINMSELDQFILTVKEAKTGDKIKLVLEDVSAEQFKLFRETKEYKELIQRDIQVHIQPVKKVKESGGDVKGDAKGIKCASFRDILRGMADKSSVSDLYTHYLK